MGKPMADESLTQNNERYFLNNEHLTMNNERYTLNNERLTVNSLLALLLRPQLLPLDGLHPQDVAHVRQQLASVVVRLALGVRQRVIRHVRDATVLCAA